ncbi:unnamed protein product [Parajaminaea phylloscopi]
MGAQASKGPKITSHDRAILDLKLQRDRIRQYQKKLLLLEEKEKAAARQLLARGDKARALSALRRGRYQRSILDKTDEQLSTLEGLVSSIEFSQIQASVYHGLEQGNAVLKEIHKELNPESVDKLLEQTAEAQAYQREVDEMLAGKMTPDEEAEVQAEMDALRRETLLEQGISEDEAVVAVEPDASRTEDVRLPDAPTTTPVSQSGKVQKQEQQQDHEQERQAVLA